MSSTDRLNVLRERNKDLLSRLKQQRHNLERVSGCGQSSGPGRQEGGEGRTDPEDALIRTDGDVAAARAALAKPNVRFADTCGDEASMIHTTPAPALTSNPRDDWGERTSDIVQDKRHLHHHTCVQERKPACTKSCLLNHSKDQGELQNAVKPDHCDELSTSDSHHLQPLLGYDWIAGILEAEDSTIERPDEFFTDLCAFRSLHRDECHHSPQVEVPETIHSGLPPLTHKDDPEANVDPHKCTFSYRINSRLFPVPLHSQECCPVCKKQKSSHPHTVTDPAHVRVSIPRCALLPPFKYKPHRRCSFDPSDSFGLPSHCLSGWSNTGPSAPPPLSSLDLRSNLKIKTCSGSWDEELERLSVSGNQIPDKISVSRLARHNFQHFSAKRK
ncbi:uncharacterized protein miip [Antennarius striatus]|uniref:uncharacterized protein miip n=1 Tax=Antennarius striatus TaxID=241820 RepID=UPI0035B49CC3